MHELEIEVARWTAAASPVALALVDRSLAVRYANARWDELTSGASGPGWLSTVAPDDRRRLESELGHAVAVGASWRGSWSLDVAGRRELHGALEPVAERAGELASFTVVDPAEWSHSPLEVGGRDSLTGLPTRDPFLRALHRACAADTGSVVAVLFVDIDSLKAINDEHGHLAGDRMIATIGRAIQSAVRSDDVAARFGGDEFVVLCRDISMADAGSLAGRVQRAIAAATTGDGRLSASIGIAATQPPVDALWLLDAADHAMYRAKRQGPGRTESIVVVGDPPAARIA